MSQEAIIELAAAIKAVGGKPSDAAAKVFSSAMAPPSGVTKVWGDPAEKKKVALAVASMAHVYFYGPTGVGKSTMARAILEGGGIPYLRFQGHEGFTSDDFYGTATLDDQGKIVVQYSNLIKAVEEGCPVILEELNLIQPVHMGPLFSFLDDTPWVDVTVAGKTKRVIKKKGFRVMATANDNGSGDTLHIYGGGNLLNKAVASRFGVFMNIGYLSTADEMDMLMYKTGLIERDLLTAMMAVADQTRKLAKSEPSKMEVALSPRNMIEWANLCIINDKCGAGVDHMAVAEMAILNRLSDSLREVLRTFVQNSFSARVPLTGLKTRPVGI